MAVSIAIVGKITKSYWVPLNHSTSKKKESPFFGGTQIGVVRTLHANYTVHASMRTVHVEYLSAFHIPLGEYTSVIGRAESRGLGGGAKGVGAKGGNCPRAP